MVRRVQETLEDDLDGGAATETVTFALDGRSFVIDLSADNAASLRAAFAPWVGVARPTGAEPSGNGRGTSRGVRARSSDSADIRRWALENGVPVNSRGRIPSDLRARYEAAHAG